MATATESPSRALTIRDQLRSPALLREIASVVPSHMKPERMVRVALTALTRTPDLARCDQASFFRCLLDLSQWGLEPDGRHAHLIPFRNTKRNCIEVQLIIDFKGLVQLAYRSGFVRSIHADVVRQGDIFDYNRGDVERHTPHFLRTDSHKPASAGDIIAVYCRVELKDGAVKCEALSKADVDGIRARSKAKGTGPWVTDYSEMAKKTAFRRVSKWIPLSAEIAEALDRDDDRLEETARIVPASDLNELAERLTGGSVAALGHDQAAIDAQDQSDDVDQSGPEDDGNQETQRSAAEMTPEELAEMEREAAGRK